MVKVKFLAVITLLLLLYPIGGGEAMSQGHSNGYAQSPTVQIRSTVDQMLRILTDPSLQGDAKKVERYRLSRETIVARFDFNEMAKRSLGSHWRLRTLEEQREFVRIFTALSEKAYLGIIDSYNNEKVFYLGEKIDGPYAEVGSKVLTTKGKEFTINYKLHRVGDGWMVYDVVVENISLVNNYRSQFSRVINKFSYDKLVTTIKQKLSDSAIKQTG